MAKKKSIEKTTQELVDELMPLLRDFEKLSANSDLRERVLALVPVYKAVRAVGPSLFPAELRADARTRLLHYFREYPLTVLGREELTVVGGIGEWARRIRELRVQFGWAILSGKAAKEMVKEQEWDAGDVDVSRLRVDDYILTSTEQDKTAAHRWNVAKEIRNRKVSVRDKLLAYLQANVGELVQGEELRYVAKNKTEWARRVRELRTEQGWPVVTKTSGRPDLPIGTYMLEQNRQSPPHDRGIPDEERRSVLRRDGYHCRRCDWSHELNNRSDPRFLELHHIIHHERGGSNAAENLITLCTVCHDKWHAVESRIGESGFMDWVEKGV